MIMCGCSLEKEVLVHYIHENALHKRSLFRAVHNKQIAFWELLMVPHDLFRICKIWEIHLYAHISGRATVAVYGCVSGKIYGCRYIGSYLTLF